MDLSGGDLCKTETMRRVDIQSALRSVVVPAYNDEEVLPEFHKRISVIWDSVRVDGELVYVNDGSTDGTQGVLQELRKRVPRIAIVDLSRNFGKEIALT